MAEEDVYCTLLLNDNYLPGAQVLAHSLRDGGTRKKLAVMVTLSGVKPATVTELKRLYNYVIPVDPIFNETPANLDLMDRLDLNAAFTKINIWKQTQFRKIVFIDADVVALRAPDELFDIEADFAAAPDIGWPDCFNSGVMLLKPDAGTYFSLLQLAGRGVSFDGADQGLFNSYFRNFHRLSFTYNCTPSASYQYVPAFRHYGSQVSLAHFIGAEKPWTIGRSSSSQQTGSPYDQLLGQWWAVWDKHFRPVLEDAKTGHQQHGTGNGNPNQFRQVYSGAPFIPGSQQEEVGKHPEIATHPSGFQQQQHQQQHQQHQEHNVQHFQQHQEHQHQHQHNVQHQQQHQEQQHFHQHQEQQHQHNHFNQHHEQEQQQHNQHSNQHQEQEQQHFHQPQQQQEQHTIPSFHPPQPQHPAKPTTTAPIPGSRVATRVWPGESSYDQASTFSPRNEPRYATAPPRSKFVPIRSIGLPPPPRSQRTEAPLVNAKSQPQVKPFYGAFPDAVMTPEGPVPQAQYFDTGPQSFLVQKYTESGEPISERVQHKFDGRMEGSQQGAVVYSAPAHKWDPAKSAPPARSAPEARHLPFMNYTNEWDKQPKQRKMVSAPTPPPVLKGRTPQQVEIQAPADPDIKPIFPWEKKPRRTSRVFADEILPFDDDDDEESPEEAVEEATQDTEDWKDYTRGNQWDSVPGIQEYVSGLTRHRTQPAETTPRAANKYISEIADERPSLPVTPAPIRRTGPHWLSAGDDEKFPSAAGIPSQEDWDPHAKLEELRGLPPAFIANILAKGTSTNGTQTDNGNSAVDINRVEEKPIERQATPSVAYSTTTAQTEPEPTIVYSTTPAQTEAPQMKDSGTQWDNEDWDEETVAPSTQPQTPTQEAPAIKLQPVPAPITKKVEVPGIVTKSNDKKSREILEETVLNKSPESKEKRTISLRRLFPRIRSRTLSQTVEVR